MRKRYAALIIVLALVISVLTGVFVYQYMQDETANFEEEIVFSLDGETQKKLSVTDLNLIPGQEKECKITLNASNVGDYVISVEFKKQSNGRLDEYLDVVIEVKGTSQTRPLNEVFSTSGGKAITFTIDAGASEILTIRYIMPETVGDEAQGASCSFEVVFTAKLAQ